MRGALDLAYGEPAAGTRKSRSGGALMERLRGREDNRACAAAAMRGVREGGRGAVVVSMCGGVGERG